MRQSMNSLKLKNLSSKNFASISESFSTWDPSFTSCNTSKNSSLRGNNPTTSSKMHEESPLLSPDSPNSERPLSARSQTHDDEYDLYQENKNLCYMVLLTVSIGGLQLAWSVELSNGSPYLISLGLSKSLMALVWIAGPLAGALVQPYVGMLSDRCTSPWGKRTPFIILGSGATIISLLALAWVRDIVWGIFGVWGADPESQAVKNCIILLAVLLVYILDFSINTVQAGIRAFILDCAPSHQQEAANSMASRIIGIGNIVGYVAGYVDLRRYMWFFGNTQFKILCMNASLALAITVFLSLSTISERHSQLDSLTTTSRSGLTSFFKSVFASIRRLPPLTRKVCEVQFFAWIGIFPQLFYSSSYVGDIYVQPYLEKNPHMSPVEIELLYEKATRIGTFALLIYAITSVTTNILLPFFIQPSNLSSKNRLTIPGFSLRRAWLLSHLLFSVCMFSAAIVRRICAATILIGVVGISWAVTLWAPFAIISEEVSRRNTTRQSLNVETSDLNSVDMGVSKDEDQAGVILGIHNMSITIPQIIATIQSSIIFKFLQKPRGTPGDRSYGVVLAVGGLFTLLAAWRVSRMEDKVDFSSDENDIVNGVRKLRTGRV